MPGKNRFFFQKKKNAIFQQKSIRENQQFVTELVLLSVTLHKSFYFRVLLFFKLQFKIPKLEKNIPIGGNSLIYQKSQTSGKIGKLDKKCQK